MIILGCVSVCRATSALHLYSRFVNKNLPEIFYFYYVVVVTRHVPGLPQEDKCQPVKSTAPSVSPVDCRPDVVFVMTGVASPPPSVTSQLLFIHEFDFLHCDDLPASDRSDSITEYSHLSDGGHLAQPCQDQQHHLHHLHAGLAESVGGEVRPPGV